MRVIIDRFEGDFAVVELPDKSFADMPKALIEGGKEGDVVDITINHGETENRKKEIRNLLDDILNK